MIVTFNTIGTIIGFAAGAYWLRSFPRRPLPRARWATAVAVLLAAIAVALTGYFMQPSYPDTVYYGQWTPVLGQFEWYRGRVLGVRLGDDALPGERLSDSRHVATLLRGAAPLHVLGIAGPKVPPPAPAPLSTISTPPHQELLLAGPA